MTARRFGPAGGALEPAALAELDERGYVALDLPWDAERALLLERFRALGVDPECPYFASSVHLDPSRSHDVDHFARSLLTDRIRALVGDVKLVLCAFISKGARIGDAVEYHQDLSFTDERLHRCTTLWIPLVEVGAGNGALAFVPGSHRWTDGCRSDDPAQPTADHQSEFAGRAVLVPLSAEQAVLRPGHAPRVRGEPVADGSPGAGSPPGAQRRSAGGAPSDGRREAGVLRGRRELLHEPALPHATGGVSAPGARVPTGSFRGLLDLARSGEQGCRRRRSLTVDRSGPSRRSGPTEFRHPGATAYPDSRDRHAAPAPVMQP